MGMGTVGLSTRSGGTGGTEIELRQVLCFIILDYSAVAFETI